MVYDLLSALGMLFSLGGNIFIIKKKKIGWLLWIVGNLCWIGVNCVGKFNLPMVVMYVVYLFINLEGYIKWHKGEY